MPALPLPFLAPILLAVLLIRLWPQRNWPFISLIALYTVSSIVVALRWSYDWETARLLQPVFALLIPPAAWLCFSRLKEPRGRWWPWLVAAFGFYCISMIWVPWNPGDVVIGSLWLGTGMALIALAWGSAGNLGPVRLTDVVKAHTALFVCGAGFAASAIYDSFIEADFDIYGGIHAGKLVAIYEILILPILAYAAAVAGPSMVPDSTAPTALNAEESLGPDVNDEQVFAAFEALMREKKLFKDPDLTLNRLARRIGVPARALSAAVNRVLGRNISQVVNEYRIAEAQALLRETALPVTSVMEAVGFRTKSNFNREFLRVTQTSPTAFRQSPDLTTQSPASAT